MTELSININKIATLRNARGQNKPDIIYWAKKIESLGAHSITIHPRPDERHITKNDVYELKKALKIGLNIEGYPSKEFCEMVLEVLPKQVTLVPDLPGQLTSNHGWDTITHKKILYETIQKLKDAGIETSIFLEPNPLMISAAADTGTQNIELYTEMYASQYKNDPAIAIKNYEITAQEAQKHKLGVHAGHDLDLENLSYLLQCIPFIKEVSIGHALICDALEYGITDTIHRYLSCLPNN